MAVSTFKFLRLTETRRHFTREYVIVPNATAGQGYSSVTGQVLDFTSVDKSGLARAIPPVAPLFSQRSIKILNAPLGFTVEIKQAAAAATLRNFVMRIFNIATAAELTTADYPAAVGGKDIVIAVTSLKVHG